MFMTKYDLHNYKLKFNMTHAHNFKDGKAIKMNNWTAFQTKHKGHTIQVNPNSLLIWSKQRTETDDPELTGDMIIKEMTEVAIDFCNKNNIQIYQIPIPIGKEVKVLDYKVNGNFLTPNIKAVYPKPSHIEFTNPSRAESEAKEFVFKADVMANALGSWSKKMDFYASNYEAHVGAIVELKNAVSELRQEVSKLNQPTLLDKVKRLFK